MADEHLVWAYCVVEGDAAPPEATGVDGHHAVESVTAAGLTAFVSRVPKSEFSADALRKNLNDLDWLARVARAHEHVLETVMTATTIVPLRLCTLYESDDGVQRMLEDEQSALTAALAALARREEWAVKLLVDPAKVEKLAESRTAEAEGVSAELDSSSAGGAYLIRRRLERQVREEAHALMASAADSLRAGLESCALDIVTRPAQNPELSGLRGRMILNAALLLDVHAVERLYALATAVEADHSSLGAQVVITGPWPPYNFVPGGDEVAVA
jgi:gas vesicle protein GvpL/GvpF